MDQNDDTINKPVEDAEIITPETDTVEISETNIVPSEEMDQTDTSISDTVEAHAAEGEKAAFSIIRLEEIIRKHLSDIERETKEMKEKKSMFEETFLNDSAYRVVEEAAQDANRKKNTLKEQILQQSAMIDLGQQISELKNDVKDLKMSLSDYLSEYQRLTQSNQIEVSEGDTREIITSTRLIKKNAKYRP